MRMLGQSKEDFSRPLDLDLRETNSPALNPNSPSTRARRTQSPCEPESGEEKPARLESGHASGLRRPERANRKGKGEAEDGGGMQHLLCRASIRLSLVRHCERLHHSLPHPTNSPLAAKRPDTDRQPWGNHETPSCSSARSLPLKGLCMPITFAPGNKEAAEARILAESSCGRKPAPEEGGWWCAGAEDAEKAGDGGGLSV